MAFTLLEVIIYAALLSGLLTGLTMVVVVGMRYFRTGEVHQRVLQEASVALTRMARELSNAQNGSLDPPAGGSWLLFLSADPPHPGAAGDWTWSGTEPEWRKWVCFYREAGSNNLVRAEQPLNAPLVIPAGGGSPPSPGLAALQAIPATPPGPRLILARSILGLAFSRQLNRLEIRVTASESTGSRTNASGESLQVTNVTLLSRVTLENQ